MSTFKDIFAYSDEEIYNICKELNFDKERLLKYCGTYRISFEHVVYRGKCYIVRDAGKTLFDLSDNELDLFYNDKFRRILRKYQSFLLKYGNNLGEVSSDNTGRIIREIENSFVNYFEKVSYDKETIMDMCKNCNIPYQETVDMTARFYINSNKKLARENMDSIRDKFSHLTNKRLEVISDLYEKVLNTKNNSEVIELCDSSIQLFNSNYFHDYAVLYYNDNYLEVIDKLKSRLAYYTQYKKNKRSEVLKEKNADKKINELDKAREIIGRFLLDRDLSVDEYCKNNGVSINKFKNIVKLLKDYNDPFYHKYNDKINYLKEKEHKLLISIGSEVLNKVKSGVIVNDEVKEFDLVDYYLLTDIPLKNVFAAIKNDFNIDDIKRFGRFYSPYSKSKELNERTINILLDSKEVFGVEVDGEGNPIKNSGREVSLEEKLYVLDYLKKNNIPLLDDTYRIALIRYLNGTLEDNKNNSKKYIRES